MDDPKRVLERNGVSGVVPADQLAGDDDEDTELLVAARKEAEQYLKSFRWCRSLKASFYGYGVGGVISAFLFWIDNAASSSDDLIWVVVGDLPSAYFVIEEAKTPKQAFGVYIRLMTEWTQAILKNGNLDEVYPVAAAPTTENAEALASRLEYVEQQILPDVPN
jgi:hypothetical protein